MKRQIIFCVVLLLMATQSLAQTSVRRTGSITATDGTVLLRVADVPGIAVAAVSGTFVATLNFEVSADCSTTGSGTYIAQSRSQVATSGAFGATATTTGTYIIPTAGFQCVRVRANPFTSGTVTITLSATSGMPLPAPITMADNLGLSSAPLVQAVLLCYDGTNLDLCRAGTAAEPVDDVAQTSSAPGIYVETVRNDAPASTATATGRNARFTSNAFGAAWVSQVDPCSSENNKVTVAFSNTARAVLITAAAGKKNYICAITAVTSTAEIISIVEGTGTTCQTGTAAKVGSTTAANGMPLPANQPWQLSGGNSTVVSGTTANVDTCMVPNGANRVAGFVTYVQR